MGFIYFIREDVVIHNTEHLQINLWKISENIKKTSQMSRKKLTFQGCRKKNLSFNKGLGQNLPFKGKKT